MVNKIRIGSPGKFDNTFGLLRFEHEQLGDMWAIVWLDSGERVAGIGSFMFPMSAEEYVKACRDQIIAKEVENILLVNE